MNLPKQFNQSELIANFNRCAKDYHQYAEIQQEINRRLLEHLDLMRLQPNIILELGAATGYGIKLLKQRYREATVIGVDFAEQMLLQLRKQAGWFKKPIVVNADIANLPFSPQSIDLIVMNLTLAWCDDLNQIFPQIRRLLKPEGVLLFSTFGPDTLREIRQSWQEVDADQHVHEFIDMHDIGDLLVQAKFLDPVMDMEYLILHYERLENLWRDLKKTGMHNRRQDRMQGLLGKEKFQHFVQQYQSLKTSDNIFPATLEIIYGHAWGNAITADATLDENGEVLIPLTQIPIRKK